MRRIEKWGEAVHGDMEHVSGHELWKSHRGTHEISQQSPEGLSVCCPGAVHQVQRDGAGTAWLCP